MLLFDRFLYFYVIGIFFLSLFEFVNQEYLGFILILLIVFNLIVFKLRWIWFVILILIVFTRSWIYFEYEQVDVNPIIGQDFTEMVVQICAEPDIRLKHVNYIVCTSNFNAQLSLEVDRSLRFLIKTNLYPKFEFGDKLLVSGLVEEPFESDEFSYKDYLKIFKVTSILKIRGKIGLLESEHSFRRQIYTLKTYLIDKSEYYLREPYSSLSTGLMLGVRKGFSEEVMDLLKITGLTHIVAVSGYNVSLVILAVDKLLFFLPRQIRFYFMVVFIVVFAIITGLSASVVRACIMGTISVLVLNFGYTSNLVRALLLTAVLMITYNPAILLYDLGFQLSFYATLGVVFIAKYFKFNFFPKKFGLREALQLTIAAQITTLPTLVYYFGTISLISPIANVLVAPLLPLIMLLGFLVLVAGWIPVVGNLIIMQISFFCEFFFIIIKLLGGIPYASLDIPVQNLLILGLVYILIFWFLFKLKDSD